MLGEVEQYSQPNCTRKLNNWFLVRYIGVIGLSTMQFGQVLASNSAVGPILAERLNWENPNQYNTYIASLPILGMGIGCYTGGLLVKGGRRRIMILMNLIAAVGICISLVLDFWTILFGKFLWGLAVGVLATAGPLMIAETIPAEEMSFWGTSSNFFIVLAISITYAWGLGLPVAGTPEVYTSDFWRFVYGYPLINVSIVLVCFVFVYRNDSLQFLIEKKEHQAALKMIKYIYTEDSNHQDILQEMIDNQQVKKNLNLTQPSMKACLTQSGLWQPQWLCFMNALFNQLSGINAINVYSVTIFTNMQNAGGSVSPMLGTQLVGLAGVLGTLIGPTVLKYTTRRQLFIGCELLMSVLLFLTGLFTYLNMSNLTLAAIFLFVITYQSTTGGAFWVYTGEVCNEKQLGVCLMALMLGILSMALFTDSLMSSPLHTCGTFWLFSACSLFASVFLFFTMKETKGLTKEEQMALWHGKSTRYSLRTQVTIRQSERLTSPNTKQLLEDNVDSENNYQNFNSVATTATGGSIVITN